MVLPSGNPGHAAGGAVASRACWVKCSFYLGQGVLRYDSLCFHLLQCGGFGMEESLGEDADRGAHVRNSLEHGGDLWLCW